MPRAKKPVKPYKPTAMERMIDECVKKSRARKKTGQTDQEWRQQYATTLKVESEALPLSETPFAGDTIKKKR